MRNGVGASRKETRPLPAHLYAFAATMPANVRKTFRKRIVLADNPSEITESSVLAERGPFFVKLSRFAGVSEALAERETAGEIPSAAEGSVLSRFAGVSEALAERETAGEIPSAAEGSVLSRFAGVSEALAERETAGEIPPAPASRGSAAEGSLLLRFAGVGEPFGRSGARRRKTDGSNQSVST